MVEELARRAKAELRKSLQRVRAATPSAARLVRSEAIRARLSAEEIYADVKSIALFRSIDRKGEVSTSGLDADARARGLRVAYPVIDEVDFDPRQLAEGQLPPQPTMSFRWVDLAPDETLESAFEERGRGFPEPISTRLAERDVLDVIVVPGLGFDQRGHRLGFGAGYYDAYLAGHQARKVGVCFDFQVLIEIPVAGHDVPVDLVVTDAQTLVPSAD